MNSLNLLDQSYSVDTELFGKRILGISADDVDACTLTGEYIYQKDGYDIIYSDISIHYCVGIREWKQFFSQIRQLMRNDAVYLFACWIQPDSSDSAHLFSCSEHDEVEEYIANLLRRRFTSDGFDVRFSSFPDIQPFSYLRDSLHEVGFAIECGWGHYLPLDLGISNMYRAEHPIADRIKEFSVIKLKF